MNKTVFLVTGTAGFLGSTVVRQLVAENKQVRAFDLPGAKGLQRSLRIKKLSTDEADSFFAS